MRANIAQPLYRRRNVSHNLCLHRLPDLTPQLPPICTVEALTKTEGELLDALDTRDIDAILIEVESEKTLQTLAEIEPRFPNVAIIGIASPDNPDLMMQALRAGCVQIVPRPIDPNELSNALRRALRLELADAERGKLYAFFGTRGTGCTTIACHYAVELAALAPSQIALFDLDLEFGSVARTFDVDPQYSISDLLSLHAPDADAIKHTSFEPVPRLRAIGRPECLHDAHAIEGQHISYILDVARRAYPHVVVDLPPTLCETTVAAIEHCTKFVLVTQLTVDSIRNAVRVCGALRAEGFAEGRIEIVINRYRKSAHRCTIEEAEQQLQHKALAVIPNDFATVARSRDAGKMLTAEHAIRGVIREMAAQLSGIKPNGNRRKWFSKLGIG